jgi:hypothetical protein
MVRLPTQKREEMMNDLRTRLFDAIEAEDFNHLNQDQKQSLINTAFSAIEPELTELKTKLRDANKERGRISTRLYLARLELRETKLRLQRLHRNQGLGAEHSQRMIRLLRDLMHAIDPSLRDGPLIEDLDHCLTLAQRHRADVRKLRDTLSTAQHHNQTSAGIPVLTDHQPSTWHTDPHDNQS